MLRCAPDSSNQNTEPGHVEVDIVELQHPLVDTYSDRLIYRLSTVSTEGESEYAQHLEVKSDLDLADVEK